VATWERSASLKEHDTIFGIRELPEIVAETGRFRLACDQLATNSAAKTVARMPVANKAIIEPVE